MNHGLGHVVSRGGAALVESHLAVLRGSEEIYECLDLSLNYHVAINMNVRMSTKLLNQARQELPLTLCACHDYAIFVISN